MRFQCKKEHEWKNHHSLKRKEQESTILEKWMIENSWLLNFRKNEKI